MLDLDLSIPSVATRSASRAVPAGYRSIAIGSASSFLVLRIGSASVWSLPLVAVE